MSDRPPRGPRVPVGHERHRGGAISTSDAGSAAVYWGRPTERSVSLVAMKMIDGEIPLPDDPGEALRVLREASHSGPVLVLKTSPICGVSAFVSSEVERWLTAPGHDEPAVAVVEIDVIARRGLARGLTTELGIRHQSPQALWFAGGALAWHGSHGEIHARRLDELAGR